MSEAAYRVAAEIPPLEEVVAVDAQGFVRPRTAATDEVAAKIFEGDGFGFTARDAATDELVGYGFFRDRRHPAGTTLYIAALITRPGYQRGIGRELLSAALASGDPRDFLAFSTQSPAMYAAGSKFVERLYPGLDGKPVPIDITLLAHSFLKPGDEVTYPVRKALYSGRPLYGERPSHPLAEQFYSYPGLDYEGGDALFCIGRIAARAASSTNLHSTTQGRASSSMELDHYADVPPNVAQAIIAKNAK